MYTEYDFRKAIENASDKAISKCDENRLLFDLDMIEFLKNEKEELSTFVNELEVESKKEAWELKALTKYIDKRIDGLQKSVGLSLYNFAVLY